MVVAYYDEADNDIIYDDSIENYIKLYNTGVNIKEIEPIANENYKIFSLANTDIRVFDTDNKNTLEAMIPLKQIKHFANDHITIDLKTGKDIEVKGNKLFYMIPIQTPRGTISNFIFRRIFDSRKSHFKSVRYHTASLNKDSYDKQEGYSKAVPLMYGWYKDFDDYAKVSGSRAKPIVVCEGPKDCMYLKQFYPYVLSLNTSTIGFNALVLRNITNKLIFVSDADDVGQKSFGLDNYILKKLHFTVGRVKLAEGVKDPASMVDKPEEEKNFKRKFLAEIQDMERY